MVKKIIMKIRKNKSKEKKADNDIPSNLFNISSSISISPSHFFFLPPFLRFLIFFSREVERKVVCLSGNEKESGNIENIFFFFFRSHLSYDKLYLYPHITIPM